MAQYLVHVAATLKRIMDVLVALLGLIALAPLLAVIAIEIRRSLGSPILFRQVRPGLHGKPFTLWKFRTMREATDRSGVPLSDADRLTKLGRLLRSTSLDELPELFNVLRGDMSLVGPRPLLVEYLGRYSAEQARRHELRPGITGWAQVHGRNALTWEDRFAMDVWYVDHWSLRLDLRILWMTIWTVVRREGISAESHVTMPHFKGIAAADRGNTA